MKWIVVLAMSCGRGGGVCPHAYSSPGATSGNQQCQVTHGARH